MNNYAVCLLAYIPIRKETDSRSEMLSQVIFGEYYEILKSNGNWHYIRMIHDGYEGWISSNSLIYIDKKEIEAYQRSDKYYSNQIFTMVNYKEEIYFPGIGSPLPFWNGKHLKIANKKFEFQGEAIKGEKSNDIDFIFETAILLLGTPYLWGGRTSYGIDCSGLVQTLFRLKNINLPRDSYKQYEMGEEVTFNKRLKGDLAFFMNDEGKVIHVGIYFGNDWILHASGSVRIDLFDEKGVYNDDIKEYTHKLKGIKRIL